MFYNDHEPPHFHVRYGEQKAIVDIETLELIDVRLSPRVLGLVTEWASFHKPDLLEDWNLAQRHAPLNKIPPLE